MSVAAMIKAMRAAGVPDAQIVDTVLEIEEERLEKGRERVRKHRNACNVTSVTEVTEVTAPSLNKKSPPDPQKKLNPTPKKKPPTGAKKKGPSLCKPDWEPAKGTVAKLIGEGHTRTAIESARLEMVDWSQGNGKLKHDWDATLRNWVRRNCKPQGHGPPSNPLAEAFANTRRKLGIDDEPDNPKTIDITANT